MSAFSELRARLVQDMAGLGVPVAASWPMVLSPPCAFIAPPLSDQYVTTSPIFGEHIVALDLVLLVDHGDADAALAELEALVEYALAHTVRGWALTGVDAPAPTSVSESGAEYLAAVIHLTSPVQMGA